MAGMGMGKSSNLVPPQPQFTTVFLWGLSNAAGLTPVPTPNFWPDNRGRLWTEFQSSVAIQMAATQTPGTVTAGPDLTFTKNLIDDNIGPIALAKVTRGGSIMSNWAPAGGNNIGTAIAVLTTAFNAMTALYPTATATILNCCIMGEQDASSFATPNQVVYIADWQACNQAVEAAFPSATVLHMGSLINVALGTMPVPFAGTTWVRAAQQAMPGLHALIDNDATVPYNIAASDPHYSSDQNQTIGHRYFLAA